MITETSLLWLGTIALLTDYVALARAQAALERTVAFLFAFLFWIGFTMNALAYNVVSGGVQLRTGSQSLALIGLVASIATLIFLVKAGFAAVNQ